MIYLVMGIKSVAWLFAFWFGIGRGMLGMLVQAAAITLFLTAVDQLTLAGNFPIPAILLTLLLYALMSFILLSVAWKMKNPAVSLGCNVMGTMGAFAIVNFTMDFLLTQLPFLNH
jgi:hypothetical protein